MEGDARAERSAGSEETVESFRDRLDAALMGALERDGRPVPAQERELRQALGVA